MLEGSQKFITLKAGTRRPQLAESADSCQIQGAHRENCPDFQVKLLSNRSIYCAYFSKSRVKSRSQGRFQDLNTCRKSVQFFQNAPNRDAEHVSTVEASIREKSRPRHLVLHNNKRSTPYQEAGPVELHRPVHSVHCASPTRYPTGMSNTLSRN